MTPGKDSIAMFTACTIIARNYLPYAEVLADSFFAHHPGGSFSILLIDDEHRQFVPADDRIEWLRLSDLGLDLPEIRRLAGIYDVTELATAVKPLLLRRLLDEQRGAVIYLDPDIRIYDALEEAAVLAARHGIVLTPHTMQPFPRDDRRVDGFFILAAGVYNLGFIAVGPTAGPFLDWWWQSTRREALIDVARMMFTDQRWVDFVPCLFDHHILKDPGYNVAYWNLHGRDLVFDGQRYQVNGVPLRFFHFSGFDVRTPWLLSKHQGDRPRVLLSERPALRRICGEYLSGLRSTPGASDVDRPYGWSVLASGLPITPRMRRLYWSGVAAAEQGKAAAPPNPFDESDPDGFLSWLNTPKQGGPRRVSRYLYSIYLERLDLQIHFPDIHGADAASYADWICTEGVAQLDIPVELLPLRDDRAGEAAPASTPARVTDGLNIAGYFRAELGIGEAARLLTTAVQAAGIPYATTTYDATLNRQSHQFLDRPAGAAAYDINLLCVNADSVTRFARDVGPEFFAGRHTVGYWFWEVDIFPVTMHSAFEVVDEVWAATDFVAGAIRAAGRKPVFVVPIPIPVLQYPSSITRGQLGLPEQFTFLLIYDFLSVLERKNPLGLIRAFSQAFSPGEGPVLVLKSINGDLRLTDLERLRAEAVDRPDIVIVDGYYSAEEKNALLGLCDCYVSLHRSEGLGLTMAEAMALGKPVIATGYSGNLHFMTPANSYLVDYRMCAVPAGCDPYPQEASWADPDVAHAATLMREVYDRPDAAALRAQRGQADILERHSAQTGAAVIAQRLQQIRQDRRNRVVVPGAATTNHSTPAGRVPGPAPAAAAAQLEACLPHLDQLATPQLSVEGRTLPGPRRAAQRMLFRLLRPYWFQQRQFHTQLIAALGHVARAIRRDEEGRDVLDGRLRSLTREVVAAKQQLRRLQQSQPTVVALEAGLRALQSDAETFQANTSAHLKQVTEILSMTEASLSTLSRKLFAVPYMSDPQKFAQSDEHGAERLGYGPAQSVGSRPFYLSFEDIFRGPENFIRERQRTYLPLLQPRRCVVDVGCGRGEMLDLLAQAEVPALGVDIDPDMVRHCRAKGHDVKHMDAVQFLQAQPEGSLAAIFSAQVLEHLTFNDLKQFLTLCHGRLESGGLLIAETVNPHALEAFKTFYTDLTHQRPIFPEVALALCQIAGFEQAYVLFPCGTGDLVQDRQSQGEYAVVATAGTPR